MLLSSQKYRFEIRDPVSGKNPIPDPQHCFLQCFGPHWFQCDTDPAFYLNANPDPNPVNQTNADPDPDQTLPS